MPAVSKAQQRFMGMVHAAQKGDMKNPSPEVSKAADSMSNKDAKDFASTSHKGLPDKIKEVVLSELRSVRAIQTDYMKVIDSMEKYLDVYKKSKGTPEEKQHIQQLKTLTAQKKKLAAELDAKVRGMYKDAELKVDEATTTGDVAGYATPYAFGRKEDEKKKGKKQADLTGYSVVKESKQYKKGDKLKIKLKNGKKFDVVFDSYSRTKGVALGKFKDGSGEYDTKPFNLDTIVESVNEAPAKTTGEKIQRYNDRVKKLRDKISSTKNPEQKMKFQNTLKGILQRLSDIKKDHGIKAPHRESVNENRWIALKKEDSPATTKVNRGISNINKQLAEIEKFLGWYGKLKQESGFSNESFWKRTNSNIYKIKERLIRLEQKIRKISE